jgi:hypothetical protein
VTLDWRDMLWKYSQQVGEAEGVDFLGRVGWTEEEWAALRALWLERGAYDPWAE